MRGWTGWSLFSRLTGISDMRWGGGAPLSWRSENFLLCKTLPNQPYVKSPTPWLTTVTSPRSAPCQAVNKVQAAWLITLTPTRVSYPAAQEFVLMIIGMYTPWLQAQPPLLQPTASFPSFKSKQRIPSIIRVQGVVRGSLLPIPYGYEVIFPDASLVNLYNHWRLFSFFLLCLFSEPAPSSLLLSGKGHVRCAFSNSPAPSPLISTSNPLPWPQKATLSSL